MKPRSEYPSEQADKFLVRFPAGMRDKITAVAKANGRSMNSEIIARLEASLDHRDPEDAAGEVEALTATIQKRVIAKLLKEYRLEKRGEK